MADTKIATYKVTHWTHAFAEPNYQKVPPLCVSVNDRAATRQGIIDSIKKNGIPFYERSHWHAHKNRSENMVNDWDYKMIAIHHAGRSYSCGVGSQAMINIQESQMNDKKAPKDDIAYHYAVNCDGAIYEGRDIRFKGGHLAEYNTGVIGIVLLENLADPDEKMDRVGVFLSIGKAIGLQAPITVPEQQKASLKKLIKVLGWFFQIEQLGGHREFPKQHNTSDGKLCPGNHGITLVKELRSWSGLASPASNQ